MIVKKRKLFTDYEKEEKWLNEMAAKGLHLIKYKLGKYSFKQGSPKEYIYRIELLDQLPSHNDSKVYINFMEENNVEYVDASFRWAYFRKKASDGPFEIYSDYGSRISHYNKIATLFGCLTLANLIIALVKLRSHHL